ncbi:MAG: propanediol dehydratase small subunit [Natronomonas sp.]|jgi:propanediol dehydratase small subunit
MTDNIEYPLADNPENVETPEGTKLSEITLEKVVEGDIDGDELVIAPETLEKQAQVAEDAGRPQVARNFRRAAELTQVPDDRILEIYNALRPSGTDKETLLEIADELEAEYDAEMNAAHVREAAEVYEQRDLI